MNCIELLYKLGRKETWCFASKISYKKMFENHIINKIISYSMEWNEEFKCEYLNQTDWTILFEKMVDNRMLLYGYNLIKKYIPDTHKSLFAERVIQYKKRIEIQVDCIRRFTEEANKREMDCFFIKGVILSEIAYGSVYLRDPGDIDIMVREEDINTAKVIMNEMGFLRTYFINGSDEHIQIREPSSNKMGVFHELVFSSVDEEQDIYVEIKVYTSAIRKKYISEFWENRQTVLVEGTDISTNDTLYTLVHLCSNVYGNTERRFNIEDQKFVLRDYIDLILLVKKYRETIDWKKIESISDHLQIKHKVKNTLININSMAKGFIKDEIIQDFDLTKTQYEISCEENGSIVEWQTSIFSRMMNREATVLEYRKLYMKRLLSDKNKLFSKQYILGGRSANDYQTILGSEDSGIPITYKFWNEHNDFHISVIMNAKELKYFIENKVHVEFHFFCCDEAFWDINRDIHKIVKLEYRNNNFYIKCGDEQVVANKDDNAEADIYNIDGSMNSKYLFGDHALIPYNIFVFETEIENTVPILTGVRFSEDEDEEETTDMEVIKV